MLPAHGAEGQVHSRPKYLALRSAAAAKAGQSAAFDGFSPSVQRTPSKDSSELSYGKFQPRLVASRFFCAFRLLANDRTAAA